MSSIVPSVGIIAYGSLISDPGPELIPDIVGKRFLRTPFKIEFARSSATRSGAPTLVPVEEGGAQVTARVLVLGKTVSLNDAEDRLWRRETDNVGTGKLYPRSSCPGPNSVLIDQHRDPSSTDILLYTRIAANINPLEASELANLAIRSARGAAGAQRRDGISYLAAALKEGIETPLSSAYRQEILARTTAATLEEAWERMRAE